MRLPIERVALHPTGEAFFADATAALSDAKIPFLLGGAYAMREYTGVCRRTKDLDIFVLPEDCAPVLDLFARLGYASELTDADWLGKIFCGEHFVDVIFSSANRIARVDQAWFDHAPYVDLFGRELSLVPPEEMIWSKAFVMERERFDGADISHLILKCGPMLDWNRLLDRMGVHWQVLLAHLALFQFAYPSEQNAVPLWVLKNLERRWKLQRHTRVREIKTCRGPLISRKEYEVDINEWGFERPQR